MATSLSGPNLSSPGNSQLRDNKIDLITTKNWDFHQRQIKNAAPGTDNNDYIVLSQLTDVQNQVTQVINNLSSQKIDLSSSVKGVLPVANGGTGAKSFGINTILLGNGTGPFTELTGVNNTIILNQVSGAQSFTATGQGYTNTTIQYKDWSGNNQSQLVVTGVTLSAIGIGSLSIQSNVITEVDLSPAVNTFTHGIKTA